MTPTTFRMLAIATDYGRLRSATLAASSTVFGPHPDAEVEEVVRIDEPTRSGKLVRLRAGHVSIEERTVTEEIPDRMRTLGHFIELVLLTTSSAEFASRPTGRRAARGASEGSWEGDPSGFMPDGGGSGDRPSEKLRVDDHHLVVSGPGPIVVAGDRPDPPVGFVSSVNVRYAGPDPAVGQAFMDALEAALR